MFVATSPSPSIPSTSSLNATQRRAFPLTSNGRHITAKSAVKSTNQVFVPKDQSFFVQISDQLLDLRRILAHGQEDDLQFGLEIGMGRVQELVSLLEDTYDALEAAKQETEGVKVELDVTRSNLKMIEKNNEMLEGAVRSLSDKHGTNPRDVGSVSWGRSTPTLLSMSSATVNVPSSHTEPPSSPPLPSAGPISSPNSTTPSSTPVQPTQEPSSRFFHKFRFNSSSSSISSTSAMNSNTNSRPQTPVVANDSPIITGAGISNRDTNTNTSIAGSDASDTPTTQIEDLQRDLSTLRSQLAHDSIELERFHSELALERKKRVNEEENVRKAMREKQELEGELESLSQALFEEANKMVSTERKLRAESESRLQKEQEELKEELREARTQREALRSALKVVESEIEVVRMGLHWGTAGVESDTVGSGSVGATSSGKDTIDRTSKPNAPHVLDVSHSTYELSTPSSLSSLEDAGSELGLGYSALPQSSSTVSTLSSPRPTMDAEQIPKRPDSDPNHSFPSNPPSSHTQPQSPFESYSTPSLSSRSSPEPLPSHSRSRSHSHSPAHSHAPPLSRSRSSSQRGIKSPPSSRSTSPSTSPSGSISMSRSSLSRQSREPNLNLSSNLGDSSSSSSNDLSHPEGYSHSIPTASTASTTLSDNLVDDSVLAWSEA
ncbi:hypothetical protein GGU11DRAFT_807810 [Lentinula aff. detonsa]|nr:hypothetical protein GGU11DRAFT_807810 [Lentinula aff. detonsa]